MSKLNCKLILWWRQTGFVSGKQEFCSVQWYHVSKRLLCNLLFYFIETVFFFLFKREAEYRKCVPLAIPFLLINRRPHKHHHAHKHSVCTAAMLQDLWSVSFLFPGQRFLLTCKNNGDICSLKKKVWASAVCSHDRGLPPIFYCQSFIPTVCSGAG